MTLRHRKTLIYFLTFALLSSALISGCTLLGGGNRKKVPTIEMIVDNPLPVKRPDEFVVLKISDIKEFAPDFSQDTFIIIQPDAEQDKQEIAHQLDDTDNDGVGDEIAMILNMEPGERKKLAIRYAPEGRAVNLGYEKRARAALHPEYEGIGWESELIAYRIYPDHRNSIGIFGKQESGLSLDKFAAGEAYNQLQPWGISVLDGGDSTGCGGFGIWHKGKLVKPLNMAGRSQVKPEDRVARYTRIVADGPVRAMVQVIYDNWRVDGQTVRVTATYSIFAGQRWMRNEIRIEGADSPVKIAAGLMSSVTGKLTRDEKNGLFHTWGAQSHRDVPDNLGMAVIYPTDSFDSFHEGDASGSHLAVLNPGADNEIFYWSLAAWSSGDIGVKREKEFAELVQSTARLLRDPITVHIMPVESPASQNMQEEAK